MDSHSSNLSNQDPFIGKIIFDKYKILKKLGGGTFGSIYSAEWENKFYAIKFEDKTKYPESLLENESCIMNYLKSPYLPVIKMFGCNNTHNILIMELMGKSLEKLFGENNKKFSVRCACNIGYQMMEMMEFIHNKNIIHRDIKPDNFVIGLNNKKKYIFILDFGLSKKYRSTIKKKHYPKIVHKNLVGTARYASINALGGVTQSRRDDLEAIGYVLLYFLRGRLPWQGIPAKNKDERNYKIMMKKKETSADELCEGFPEQFSNYINYSRNLEYEQDPDYNYLKNLFISVLNMYGFQIDCFYDWDTETIIYNRQNISLIQSSSIRNTNLNIIENNNITNNIISSKNLNKNQQIQMNNKQNQINYSNHNIQNINQNQLNNNINEKQINEVNKRPNNHCECCIII